MRKLFGTDGVRGKVNNYPMVPEIALKLGMAAAAVLRDDNRDFKVIIGKDTRVSGYVFEYALTSGLCSMGANVYLVGPMPTPAIAYLTRSFSATAGIMITASHNPADDNGIKFFDCNGYKLPDEVEEKIEEMVFKNEFPLSKIKPSDTGKAFRMFEVIGRYVEFVKKSINNTSLKGMKLVLDCANGGGYKVAPIVFSELGADITVFGDKPDGVNINKDCGSLHPEKLAMAVKESKADIGIALDGDADRLIVVDENGEVLDGDELMAIYAVNLKMKNMLTKNTVVATVVSNMGFEIAMNKNGINVVRTKVGDRYVIEEMRKHGYNLGGEQSGHIIFSYCTTTGDGIISALWLLRIMKETGKKLSELKRCMVKYPQASVNVAVREKPPLETIKSVNDTISSCEKKLGNTGRILVRYSGTENKCRVMVEGKDNDLIKDCCNRIAGSIEKEIGKEKADKADKTDEADEIVDEITEENGKR